MSIATAWLIANAASIIMAAGAFVLAYNSMDGWGWFLFCSILCGASASVDKD